jgi:hypothetical protein
MNAKVKAQAAKIKKKRLRLREGPDHRYLAASLLAVLLIAVWTVQQNRLTPAKDESVVVSAPRSEPAARAAPPPKDFILAVEKHEEWARENPEERRQADAKMFPTDNVPEFIPLRDMLPALKDFHNREFFVLLDKEPDEDDLETWASKGVRMGEMFGARSWQALVRDRKSLEQFGDSTFVAWADPYAMLKPEPKAESEPEAEQDLEEEDARRD